MIQARQQTKSRSIAKAYTDASEEAERAWKKIISYCREHRQQFVDDSFPPCDKSLFIDPKSKPKNCPIKDVVWLRPQFIRTQYKEPWSVMNNPSYNDIKQGNFFWKF
jgi:calpain-15